MVNGVKQNDMNDNLNSVLYKRKYIDRKAWLSSLSARKRNEMIFHDEWRNRHHRSGESDERSNEKYYDSIRKVRHYINDWVVNNSGNKIFLDYACGDGLFAISAAQSGAIISIGIDISPTSIANCLLQAEQLGISDVANFIVADCEDTGLPDESIDVVICSGMLHHLKIDLAYKELFRILKPQGKILVIEALSYNPLIKLYRKMTPHLRTEWESKHILSLKDMYVAKKYFELRDIRYWHLISIFATFFRGAKYFDSLLGLADRIDNILLKIYPFNLMAWMFSFELVKHNK